MSEFNYRPPFTTTTTQMLAKTCGSTLLSDAGNEKKSLKTAKKSTYITTKETTVEFHPMVKKISSFIKNLITKIK